MSVDPTKKIEIASLFNALFKSEKNHFIYQKGKELQLSCLPESTFYGPTSTVLLFFLSNKTTDLFLYTTDINTAQNKDELQKTIAQADQIVTIVSNHEFSLQKVPSKLSLTLGPGYFLTHTLFELIAQWPYCTPKERSDFFSQWSLQLSDWLISYVNEDAKLPLTIEKAITYIEQKNHDPHLSLEDTATYCNLSTRMLQKQFQRLGFSFSHYVNEIRLANAAIQLFKSEASITQIAFQCGFSSSAYFTKRFKERYEVTPKTYRQKMQATLSIDQKQHNDCPLAGSACQITAF